MRLIVRFAQEHKDTFEIVDVFDEKIERQEVSKEKPLVDSIMTKYPSAIWMERKISDEFGIIFNRAFDTRPTIKHERFPKELFPMRKDFQDKALEYSNFVPYKYEEIDGEGIFVVPVGPIHAGVIEPGHFQFSQAGEEILHLEVRHFYKYRAIEKMVEGKNPRAIKPIVERISGNESIAYQIALFEILAEASRVEIPESKKRHYFALLELERIIHHLTDLGFIPNDAGFASALAFMSKLAEEARRTMHHLTSHRFGFGAINEETTLDFDHLNEFVLSLQKEVEFFEKWIEGIPSVWDRFDTTGRLNPKKATKYGAVGLVARASGIAVDQRAISGWHEQYGYQMQLGKKGEVADRFRLRIQEIYNSITMIEAFAHQEEEQFTFKSFNDGEYMSRVESSIGELFLYLNIQNGVVERMVVRDPSFINWQVFHTTIYKDIIADFPLINKSFDLSYAGSDL